MEKEFAWRRSFWVLKGHKYPVRLIELTFWNRYATKARLLPAADAAENCITCMSFASLEGTYSPPYQGTINEPSQLFKAQLTELI